MSQTLNFSSLFFSQALRDNDDIALGLPSWRAEHVKQLAAIYQIKIWVSSYLSPLSRVAENDYRNLMRCFVIQNSHVKMSNQIKWS